MGREQMCDALGLAARIQFYTFVPTKIDAAVVLLVRGGLWESRLFA